MKLSQQQSHDIMALIIIDSEVIKLHAWLLENVLLDFVRIFSEFGENWQLPLKNHR